MGQEKIIFNIAESVSNNVKRKDLKNSLKLEESNIKEAVVNLLADNELILELKNKLFPVEVSLDKDFFEKIQDFYVLCGFNDNTRLLCAKISKLIFEEIGILKTNILLDILINTKDRFVWIYLGVLKHLLGMYDIGPKFATIWFRNMTEKIHTDLAGGDFYSGIENYSLSFPASALIIVSELLKQDLDSINVSLISLITGTIRSNPSFIVDYNLTSLDAQLKNSGNEKERKCYYYSISTTYRKSNIDLKELEVILNDINKDINKDIQESQFVLLERCSVFSNKNKDFVVFAVNWIKGHLQNLTDNSQYSISVILYWLAKEFKWLDSIAIVKELNEILFRIQPVNSKNKGTWRNIEYYLEDLLEYDYECFNTALYGLIEKSFDSLLDLYHNDNQFLLFHTLETKGYNEFVFHLLVSENINIRNFGFELTKILGITIPKSLDSNGMVEKELLKLLYGTTLRYIGSDKIGDFLLTIEPLFRNSKAETKDEFIEEMIFQALNFRNACLDKWDRVIEKSEILKKVVSISKLYYENLIKTNGLPVNSYVYPMIEDGEYQWQRKFSQGLDQSVKEKSIFLKLVRTTNILYGNKWSIFDHEQKIHDPTGFNETKAVFEWPRLEIIDPEGMGIRRMNIMSKLKNLTK